MLNDALWPKASRLIDEACGAKGNIMFFGRVDPSDSVEFYFAKSYYRGEKRPEVIHDYLMHYHATDEHIPRMRNLPDGKIVPVAELFTEEERKSSRCYNEIYSWYQVQKALEVRLDGPDDSHIVWALADPVDSIAWSSPRVEMISRLLPQLRQYARVHSALVEANAPGDAAMKLLESTRVGIIQMDRRGMIVEMNEQAGKLVRSCNGLSCRADSLVAVQPKDQSRLDTLLARALPRYTDQAMSGSMVIRRSSLFPMLVLHVLPVSSRDEHYRARRIAALILVIDPMDRARIDSSLMQEILGLTPKEARIAVMLAEGRTLRQIAAITGRRYSTLRTQLNHIYTKLGLSRQVELVQTLLALSKLSAPKD